MGLPSRKTLRIIGEFAVGKERIDIARQWGISYARVQQLTSMTEYGQGSRKCRYAKDRREQFSLLQGYKAEFDSVMEVV